jgi:NADH-quinone oxidoreductase subunit E
MLTAEEKNHLIEHIAHYPEPRAGAIYTLQFLQDKVGYLSDQAVQLASELCGLSVTQLDELITFYTLLRRRPSGRFILRICDSIACHLAGADQVIASAVEESGVALGGNSADGAVTVLPSVCLGLCDLAPAAIVNDKAEGKLSEASVKQLIADLRIRHQQTQPDRIAVSQQPATHDFAGEN